MRSYSTANRGCICMPLKLVGRDKLPGFGIACKTESTRSRGNVPKKIALHNISIHIDMLDMMTLRTDNE